MSWKETHSNHSEKNTGRSERGLSWRHAHRLLRAVQGTNGPVQRWENTVPPLQLLGFVRHGRNDEKAV